MSSGATDDLLRWIEIDTDALAANVHAMRALLQPSTQVMAMVKSRGYGHGATLVARAALEAGATWLGVYTPDEALQLRAAGIDARILVAGWSPPGTMREMLRNGVDIAICDVADIAAARDAAPHDMPARVHLKIDTGLGRLGLRAETLDTAVDALREAAGRVDVTGIFTHFADPLDVGFTRVQHDRFLQAVERLRPVARQALLHECGSVATVTVPEMQQDMVRLGIGMYGYLADPLHAPVALRPVMSLFGRVAQVKRVAAGEPVGYGRTWYASTDRWIAAVAVGYGQGLPRLLSNSGQVVVHGRRAPIVGAVSMDQVTVDVTDVQPVAPGDVAMVFGVTGGVRLGADEVAALSGTISYEVLTGVADALPRLVATGAVRPGEATLKAVP